ncbi:hypothetical protein BT93_L2441 [Corymbia citriodora subsp. variegata]|uniref:Uncharacterized protein n=1 Tax=Corymbia citriodora subsp. variegata TaxID=360336 RepID=A0A8T0CJJ0_CORYI|nr:hypothetical protein BT93_L2441 [Corymbia citriodora subsp. variegata]
MVHQTGLWNDFHSSLFEPRSSGKRRKKDEVRNWQLQLKKGLPSSVYTEQKLTIDVKLVDANTGDIVKLGPQSSVKVEVMVVDSDHENWTHEDLKKPLDPRKGKAPLLSGDLQVNLNGGTGVLHNVCFTDNSSWTRSGKFRLAVRVLPEHHEYISEAISEPITVKAKRGQAYEKHYPPQPEDELWRFEKIGKDGSFRLKNFGISTVREFLQQHDMDPKRLREILGMKMDKNWEGLIAHAKTCPLNGNRNENNESDSGRQLTDHNADRVHRADDKFSPKQEVTGKFSSFRYLLCNLRGIARDLRISVKFILYCQLISHLFLWGTNELS